jgi:hypothetical protein
MDHEPFVSPEAAASFLSTTKRQLLTMARSAQLPAHPLRRGARNQWRFLLSELHEHLTKNVVPTTKGPSPSRPQNTGDCR